MEEQAEKLHLFYKDESELTLRLPSSDKPVVLSGITVRLF